MINNKILPWSVDGRSYSINVSLKTERLFVKDDTPETEKKV